MTTVRDLIRRDIGVKVEGVVKVFDWASLATEMREYVVTDKIEDELKRIFDTFTQVSETLRHGGQARDVMGMWVSGFFGSGKSHFAKVLGHLIQNSHLDDCGTERCIDAFTRDLSDTPRGRDIRLRLGELKLSTETRAVFFEIKSRQPYGQARIRRRDPPLRVLSLHRLLRKPARRGDRAESRTPRSPRKARIRVRRAVRDSVAQRRRPR